MLHTYLYCYVDLPQLTDPIQGLRSRLNDKPSTVDKRLRPQAYLDPDEEKFTVLVVDGIKVRVVELRNCMQAMG